ncbi:hypothetical protein [Streptomyces sp. 184]|uniref:hypothetical protein n=1 Tax=Streptomyces sp. 184 TaxID=1827526 RepID=UPI00389177C0
MRERLGGGSAEPRAGTAEIRPDSPEDRGGRPKDEVEGETEDLHSTTGTTSDDAHVGRIAGDDPGYLETGAENRAAPKPDPDDKNT